MVGIDGYRRELAASGRLYRARDCRPPWGREIGLVDPFGNRLRFCERPPG